MTHSAFGANCRVIETTIDNESFSFSTPTTTTTTDYGHRQSEIIEKKIFFFLLTLLYIQ